MTGKGCYMPRIMEQLMQHVLRQGTMPLQDGEQVALIEPDEIEEKDSQHSATREKKHVHQLGVLHRRWAENLTKYLGHVFICLSGRTRPHSDQGSSPLDGPPLYLRIY
jgi:hypothetical protein